MASSSFAVRRNEALSDHDSQSSVTYYELPSNHFLAQPGGQPSSSSWSAKQDRHTSSESHSNGKQSVNHLLLETQTSASSTSDDRDQLSFIPDHISRGFHDPSADTVEGQQIRAHMPDVSTLAAADFDVDVRSGFLPPEAPVSRLGGIEEELWETALDKARALPLRIGGGGLQVSESDRKAAREWRRAIRQMLVLHPSPEITSDIRFARRAHLVLSWLAHLYIHSQPYPNNNSTSSTSFWLSNWSFRSQDDTDIREEMAGKYGSTIPASIAVPWVVVSKQLDLPPILTYATTVLWNWNYYDSSKGFQDDNVYVTNTFSGTPSEEHFFKTSLLIERKGVAALTLMRRSLDEAFVGDSLARRRISKYLKLLAHVIEELTQLLHDVRLGCDPSIFYWGIRPWFNGGDSYVDKLTSEKGWIYEGVEEYEGKRKLFMGPSAGQSSLIHSLDVFLGVDHAKKTEEGQSASETENATFMEKMQFYMPGHHRNFLTHLRSISFAAEEIDINGAENNQTEKQPLRALMVCEDDGSVSPAVKTLRQSYNDTLTSLKHLRDEHMRIATTYIIQQMRTVPPLEYSKLDLNLVTRLNKAEGVADERSEEGAKGTGGTDLVSFLKDCRKNTIAALHLS